MRIMLIVAVVSLVLTENRLGARSCAPPPPLCEAANRADVVFFGEVLEEIIYTEQTPRGPKPEGIQAVRFNVIDAFKGVEAGSWRLYYWGVEARPFRAGGHYVVFAHRRETGAFVTGCTLTREIRRFPYSEWSAIEVAKHRACFKTGG